MKFDVKKLIPHSIAILVFIGFAAFYFSPVWEGNQLMQSDVKQYQGAAKEITDYRMVNGDEALWTNGMFSGMPAYQISVKHSGNYIAKIGEWLRLGLPVPVGILFVTMLGFYFLGMCLRIKPWVAIVGALAFGFASFNILYLGAGHLTKVNAVSFMAPTLGGLLLATRGKWLWGSVVFSFFLALNLSANHFQISYYLMIMLTIVAVAEGIRLLLEKQTMPLLKATAGLAIGGFLAVLPSASNLMTTYEYAKYSTRGESDISVVPKGKEKEAKAKSGLDRNYILEYNFGPGEALSLFIPNAKGGAGGYIANNEDAMGAINDPTYTEQVGKSNHYWGGQMFSGGAIYLGAVAFFLFFAALFLVKDTLKFPAIALLVLCTLLSLKSGSLNFWFIDHFPLYNKFRDTKMILVILQVFVPLMGMLMLDSVWKSEEVALAVKDKNNRSRIMRYSVLGGLVLVAAILYFSPSISGSFITSEEAKQFDAYAKKSPDQMAAIQGLRSELTHVRKTIYQADAQRSLTFVILSAAVLFLALFYLKNKWIWLGAFAMLIAVDEIQIAKRYLNNEEVEGIYEKYEAVNQNQIPYPSGKADTEILRIESKQVPQFDQKVSQAKKAIVDANIYGEQSEEEINKMAQFTALQLHSNYRVLTFENPFNETVTSFFHKSIGGYHGAKVKRYQQMVDFYMDNEMNRANRAISAIKMNKLQEYAKTLTLPNDKMQEIFDTISVAGGELNDSCQILNMLNTKYVVVKRNDAPVINRHVNGNVWFVRQVQQVKNANEALLGLGKLNTKTQAILDVSSTNLKVKPSYTTDSMDMISMTKYGTKEIRYKSNSKHPGFAVFSEIYYPEGWVCTIDGKEVEYCNVNYVLRGMEVPAGSHEIVWRFEPKSFHRGSLLSKIGSLLLLISFFGLGFREVRRDEKQDKEEKKRLE